MAGAGRRTFQPGEVLTASNVNSYLMDQSVMRFASSAARGSAVGTAVIAEGMVSYLDDANALEFYDGAAWNRFAAGSGLPIANGGTGGTTVAQAQDNLGIGLIPIVPSSVGVSAGTATIGPLGLVEVSGSNTTSFNGVFSTDYSKYRIIISGMVFSATADMFLRLRSGTTDVATNYYFNQVQVNNTTVSGEAGVAATTGWAVGITGSSAIGGVASSEIELYRPAAALKTNFKAHFYGYTTVNFSKVSRGFHDTASAYTAFTLYQTNSATATYSIQIFGYNE